MSRHVMKLLEFVKAEIGGERWTSYERCAGVGQKALWKTTGFENPFQTLDEIPYDDPVAKCLYDQRCSFERGFVEIIRQAGSDGQIVIEGLEYDSGKFEVIDARLMLAPFVNWAKNEIGTARHHYTSVEIAIVKSSGSRRNAQISRQSVDMIRVELEGAIAGWLEELEASGIAPNTEKWFFAQAQDRFRNPHLSAFLFRRVWRALPFPHPLKRGGRPPRC